MPSRTNVTSQNNEQESKDQIAEAQQDIQVDPLDIMHQQARKIIPRSSEAAPLIPHLQLSESANTCAAETLTRHCTIFSKNKAEMTRRSPEIGPEMLAAINKTSTAP